MRAVRAAVLTAAIVTGALACGSDDSGESMRGAVDKTLDAGPAKVAVSFGFHESGKPADEDEFARGFQDTTRDRVLLTSGERRTFYDRGVLFVRPRYELPPGKRWLRLDYRAAGTGSPRGPLGTFDNPSDSLRHARAIGNVEEVGTERVRGVECTHYSGTLDVDDVPRELPRDRLWNGRYQVNELKKHLIGTRVPVDVWVDGDDLIRRIEETWTSSVRGRKQTAEMTMEFYDFGVRAAIEPPPATEALDFSSDEAESFYNRAARARAKRQG
jgi:hypothetical protein